MRSPLFPAVMGWQGNDCIHWTVTPCCGDIPCLRAVGSRGTSGLHPEPQDGCHQHTLSVSLLLLLFLGHLDVPCRTPLMAATDVLWWSLPSRGGPCCPMAALASTHFGKLGVGAGFQGEEDRGLRPRSAQDLDVHLSRLRGCFGHWDRVRWR